MALNKQSLNINFAQGLNTKTDPFQVPVGQFLSLTNTIFSKGGLLQKRNGFTQLQALPNSSFEHITTFNGNLTAIGTNLAAFSEGSGTWVNTGAIQPMNLEVQPVVRSNSNQVQADSAVSTNNLVCTVFVDNNGSTSVPKYIITDYVTGQVIIPATVIAPSSGTILASPRVFTLGRYFIIVFGAVISAVDHLQYIAISTTNPTIVTTATDISAQYTSAATVPFDGIVSNNILYLAWNANDAGGALRSTSLSSFLVQGSVKVVPGSADLPAAYVSIAADNSGTTPVIWTFWFSTSTYGYAAAQDHNLNTILTATAVIASDSPATVNLACVANNEVLTVFYETSATYSYDSTLVTNYIKTNTLTQAGTLGTSKVLVRSVGLASKAFMVNNVPFFLAVYGSVYQPTYFLINGNTGGVSAKIAYSNGSADLTPGSAYLPTGLPSANVHSDGITVDIAYLYKDSIQSVNNNSIAATTATSLPGILTQISASAAIYSQTGINLATMSLNSQDVVTSEIGNNLNISGGIMWAYDGQVPVEQNFNVWPDSVEGTPAASGGAMLAQQYYYQAIYKWTDNQGNTFVSAPSIPNTVTTVAGSGITFDSVFSSGVSSITVSSATGLFVGQVITDTTTSGNITPGTYISSISGTTVGLSQPTAGASTTSPGDVLSTTQQAEVTLNIPTLRLTYKTANPVKIELYRWSAAQQSYFQVTSISAPLLNNPAVDSVSFVDKLSDQAIVGNSLIYTTGGVVEDIGPPATYTTTLFDDRLWAVDAEDRNLLWYSKQVIEGTPVEMSDLFTLFVAPTLGAQGSTGVITALAAMDDKLVIFKEDAIYYINGIGPDNTGANSTYSQPIFITSTVGCTNQNSLVLMPSGLMFQSDKGIWLLGRDLSTNYIGAPVEEFNSATVATALAIPGTNQVRFTLNSGVTLMYDYYFQQWGSFVGIPAIGSTLYQELHTFINSSGQVLQESPGEYLDGTNAVLMSFTTGWINMAGLQGYERAYMFYLLGSYISPHQLVMQIAYDYSPAATQLSIISPDNYNAPWGSDQVWGQSTPWGGQPTLEQWKVHLQRQTCQSFQIIMNELYDSRYGVPPGAGVTLSGINCTIGIKKGYRPIRANSVG